MLILTSSSVRNQAILMVVWTVAVLMLAIVGCSDHTSRATISRETTYLTDSIGEDGIPEYIRVCNEEYGKGIAPQDNAVVLLHRVFGWQSIPAEYREEYASLLGCALDASSAPVFIDWLDYCMSSDEKSICRLPEDSPGRKHINRELPEDSVDDEISRRKEQLASMFDTAIARPWTSREYPELYDWLRSVERPLETLVKASKRTAYFSPLIARVDQNDVVMIGQVCPTAAIDAMIVRAMLQCGERHIDLSWQDLLACHRLVGLGHSASSLGEFACYSAAMGRVVRADLILLSSADMNVTQIRRILSDLDGIPRNNAVRRITDRSARFSWLLWLLERPSTSEESHPLRRDSLDRNLRMANEYVDTIVAAMGARAYRDQIEAVGAIEKKYHDLECQTITEGNSDYALSVWLRSRPTMIGFYLEREADWLTFVEIVKAAFALKAYHMAHASYPEELNDLSPQYLADIPHDPYSGGSLLYHRTDGGYLLDSVGLNGVAEAVIGEDAEKHVGDDTVIEIMSSGTVMLCVRGRTWQYELGIAVPRPVQ